HYLNVAFDLSEVLFVATANVLDTIPAPLRDRMEILQIAGYTPGEKLHIAERYLLPRQRAENGLRPEELSISSDALLTVIHEYTREAGVRELERQIGRICRKVATALAEGKEKVQVGEKELEPYLGKPRFEAEMRE